MDKSSARIVFGDIISITRQSNAVNALTKSTDVRTAAMMNQRLQESIAIPVNTHSSLTSQCKCAKTAAITLMAASAVI